MRWPEVTAQYKKPLCTVDVDIAKIAHLESIMARFDSASFGCFERKRERAALVCHASLIASGNDTASDAFTDLTSKFLATMIPSDPFWMLDQIALLIASRFLIETNSAFRCVDLAQVTGLSYDDCFQSAGNVAEKLALRRALFEVGLTGVEFRHSARD